MLERIGEVECNVALPPSMDIHPVFHVPLLAAHKQQTPHMAQPIDWETADHPDDGSPIYEVGTILEQQGEGSNARYLIKWKGSLDLNAT